MTVNGGQATGLFFIFGWRGADGPFYIGGANTAPQAIEKARAALKHWTRTAAHDVRTNDVVFDAAVTD